MTNDRDASYLSISEKKEFCGLTAIVGHSEAINLATLGLFALQHRGEEACGIAYTDPRVDPNGRIVTQLGQGTVQQVLRLTPSSSAEETMGNDMGSDGNLSPQQKAPPPLPIAIGHTRYSVTGGSRATNLQPMAVEHLKGSFALAHNGNLTNSRPLKHKLEQMGAIFQTSMDSEIFVHLIAKSSTATFKDSIIDALHQVDGAYSLLILEKDRVYAIRDPRGFRPLSLGLIYDPQNKCKVLVAASETCALDFMGAENLGTVRPGELVTLHLNGEMEREKIFSAETLHARKIEETRCIFELIYFARPDSMVFDESVYAFRKRLGNILAEESPVEADIVMPIPDSGNVPALGYSEASGIPIEFAITRNHYTSRSFIQPNDKSRQQMVRLKLNPIRSVIEGKRVVIIDDSIVRGTTTKAKIQSIKDAGALEVHMRVASPPIISGCYYGIDFPDKKSLIAHQRSIEEIREKLGLDSLAYISREGMLTASARKVKGFCTACFTGNYPSPIDQGYTKESLSRAQQVAPPSPTPMPVTSPHPKNAL